VGPLLAPLEEAGEPSPLARMNTAERLTADYHGTGLTIGKHPMAYRRGEMDALRVTRAIDLAQIPTAASCASPARWWCASAPAPPKVSSSSAWEDETGIMKCNHRAAHL